MRPIALLLVTVATGCVRAPDASPGPESAGQPPVAPVAPVAPSGAGGEAASPPAEGAAGGEAAPIGDRAAAGAAEAAGETVERLQQRARRELGERASFALVRERFLMVGEAGWVKTSAAFSERVLGALLNERFDRVPASALPVYVFGDAGSYEAYCKQQYGHGCISIYGFFSPSDRRLVMNVGLGIGTLSHELVHPLVEADFPDAPTWLNEGIASLYEAPLMPRQGEIHGAKNWRFPRLQAAMASPRDRDKVSVEGIFGLSDGAFRGEDEALNYAMARYLCQWLDGKKQLWAFYRGWRDGVARDRTGEGAFRAATGMMPSEATAEWRRWLRSL